MNRTFHHDMSSEEYHALPAIGSTALKCFIQQGPLDYYWKYVLGRHEEKEKYAYTMGTAFHLAMEYPTDWQDFVAAEPEVVRNDGVYAEFLELAHAEIHGTKSTVTRVGEELGDSRKFDKAYKQAFKDWASDHGKLVIKQEDVDKVIAQQLAVYDHYEVRQFIDSCPDRETPVTLELNGITAKALMDISNEWQFGDFKTTRFRNIHSFYRLGFRKLGYDYQFAHYRLVSGMNVHKLISVTNAAPYEAHLFDVTERMIEEQIKDVDRHLEWLAQHSSQLSDNALLCSQGIPHDWHSEFWGAEIDMEEVFLQDQPVLISGVTEEVDYGDS